MADAHLRTLAVDRVVASLAGEAGVSRLLLDVALAGLRQESHVRRLVQRSLPLSVSYTHLTLPTNREV